MKVNKKCERCKRMYKSLWKYRGFFYCYNCYRRRFKERMSNKE